MDETFAGLELGSAIGQCRGCHTRGELNGDGFCGGCADDFHALSTPVEGADLNQAADRGTKQVLASTAAGSIRTGLLDYIVTKASQAFIDEVYTAKFEEFRQSQAWIEWLEQELNERKLLRLATQLGYGKKVRKPRRDAGVKRPNKVATKPSSGKS